MPTAQSSRCNFLALTALTAALIGCGSHKEPATSFEVASKGVVAGAISDNGEYAVIGAVHQGGSLWRTRDGERLYNWNHNAGELTSIIAADFSPDGDWALTADPHTLVLWRTNTGEAARFWTAPGQILSVSLSPNGNYALLGLDDHTAVLFDVKRGGIKRTFNHDNRVRSVDLSEQGNLVITGSEDFTAKVWSLTDLANQDQPLQPRHTIKHKEEVQMVALSPDGRLAMSASKYDKAIVWETGSGKILGEIPLSAEKVNRGLRFTAARFNADGSRLLTGRADQIVQLWDTRTLKEIESWVLPKRDAWKPTSAAVVAVGFAKQGNAFYAIASNGFVHQLKQ